MGRSLVQIATKKLQGNFNYGLNYIHILDSADVSTCQFSTEFDATKDMFTKP